ncbi:hypothetical protein EXIGLDRAFT_616853, partial [Exidia glandulosa HHB12029]
MEKSGSKSRALIAWAEFRSVCWAAVSSPETRVDPSHAPLPPQPHVPFGVTYVKIGTIQRRLAWPLHKDDTLRQSG